MSGFLRFVVVSVFVLILGLPKGAVAQDGGARVGNSIIVDKQSGVRGIGALGSDTLGGAPLSAKTVNGDAATASWSRFIPSNINWGIGRGSNGKWTVGVGGQVNPTGGGFGGMGGLGGTGGFGGGVGMGGGNFNAQSYNLACLVLSIPQGSFGALLMVVSGLMAVIGAALGMYKLALSTLVVGIGSWLIQPIVSLFFGGFGC